MSWDGLPEKIWLEVGRAPRPISQWEIVKPLLPMLVMLSMAAVLAYSAPVGWLWILFAAMAGLTLVVMVVAWILHGKRLKGDGRAR